MLRVLISIFLLAQSPSVLAAQFIVHDPCHNQAWLDRKIDAPIGASIGSITVETLDLSGITYIGNERGINSIRNTVTGKDALEVVNDGEMRAYGWCFRINGHKPELYANEVFIESETDVITWSFGFAHYQDGTWDSLCTPTHIARPKFICN